MDREGPLKIAFATLGCKVNQNDASCLAAELSNLGHRIVPFRQSADVFIIHTCTVTQKTDFQSRQLIRRAAARNPDGRIVVTGCYAQVSPETLAEIPGVDFIVGIGERGRIPGMVSAAGKCEKPRVFSAPLATPRLFEEAPLPLSPQRTRAYLKVQDGCDSFCSYCIVPFARGRNRSLPLDRVLTRARELSEKGFKEVILTGIHLGAYGEDLSPRASLLELLRALENVPLDFRLRLSSIEPAEFTPELVDFLAASHIICPHLHIPLQSGSDGVLRRMNRDYTRAFYQDLVTGLTRSIPGLAVGADVIGGFPGEDQTAFQESLSLIEALPLAYLHVFPYSGRKGTPAADFPGQVPSRTVRDRCEALRDLGREKRRQFYRSFLGEKMRVLVESRRDRESGMLRGYSQNYIPVVFTGKDEWMNQVVEVEVTGTGEDKVFGKAHDLNAP